MWAMGYMSRFCHVTLQIWKEHLVIVLRPIHLNPMDTKRNITVYNSLVPLYDFHVCLNFVFQL